MLDDWSPLRQCKVKSYMLERAHHTIEISTASLATKVIEHSKQQALYHERALGTAFIISPELPLSHLGQRHYSTLLQAMLSLQTFLQTSLCAERFYQAFREAGYPRRLSISTHESNRCL